ncbi:unnamed protein product (macronuclear) [Paramecium tetraurelia]|uniref:Transmembrane protein n=1 Tax=Paramecium tetraurelia TaxID=5888 RepID=A0EA83_PARTE|nr:uncharacterized protein GSPATT00024932001 [Paramecium tetraurelia]CAK92200.1 unnamed protein product [Paramecium tetraurelia]|eukprot:XP_001459597.1 hypothetical protein (macronuclear) [Paramecium tetraurelia strain d4-2]
MCKSNNDQDQPKKSKQYQKIECNQRKLVLDMLLNQKLSLQEVCSITILIPRLLYPYIYIYCFFNQYLNRWLTNLRTIQKTYEKDGRIGKKETRKKKLKVQNILKISVINPFTLEVQPLSVQSDIHQIYVDKQPSLLDQIALANQQHSILQSQCLRFSSELASNMNQPNFAYQSTLQNLLLSSQYVFKSILDLKPQGQIKQEFGSLPQPLPQCFYTQQPYQHQPYPLTYTQLRT